MFYYFFVPVFCRCVVALVEFEVVVLRCLRYGFLQVREAALRNPDQEQGEVARVFKGAEKAVSLVSYLKFFE